MVTRDRDHTRSRRCVGFQVGRLNGNVNIESLIHRTWRSTQSFRKVVRNNFTKPKYGKLSRGPIEKM